MALEPLKRGLIMKIRDVRKIWLPALAFIWLLPEAVFAVGGQFGMEFAIDAPWRLEPFKNQQGQTEYGPIPITITFLDLNFSEAVRSPGDKGVGKFQYVTIVERQAAGDNPDLNFTTTFQLNDLREIERKMRLSKPSEEPERELCRPSQGQNCEALREISKKVLDPSSNPTGLYKLGQRMVWNVVVYSQGTDDTGS